MLLRHIELSLSGSGMECYSPGDLLNVWPRPDPAAVDAFLLRMDLRGEDRIRVQVADDVPLPEDRSSAGEDDRKYTASRGGVTVGGDGCMLPRGPLNTSAEGTIREFVEVRYLQVKPWLVLSGCSYDVE